MLTDSYTSESMAAIITLDRRTSYPMQPQTLYRLADEHRFTPICSIAKALLMVRVCTYAKSKRGKKKNKKGGVRGHRDLGTRARSLPEFCG
jgi:hypothetical protein